MDATLITARMSVWSVIQRYPQTCEVFRKHGCPDMRKGVFAISARIMRVAWAARAHKIDLNTLLRDLNACVNPLHEA